MDWPTIGGWAGEHGPWVGIILAQWAVIWRLLNRFFAQQDMVMKALSLTDRATQVAAEATVLTKEER
jgi:hypothetical protein